MIVRDDGGALLLITQPDHAQLAHAIVAAMRTEPALHTARRETVLLATREHDNGWLEVDAEPTIDPESGRPCDFIAGPAHIKHELWPRGIRRVAADNLRAGALVAQHALTVYSYRAGDPEWQPFFRTVTALRDELLRQVRADTGAAREQFEVDYRCVRLGDFFSLQFCNGWTTPQETFGYRAQLRGSTLLIAPDPFEGATVPLQVIARRILARRYASDGDLRTAVAAAIPEILSGEIRGVTHVNDM